MRGCRAGEAYFSVTVYNMAEPGMFATGHVSEVNDRALVVDAAGCYSILVRAVVWEGCRVREWKDVRLLFVRFTFGADFPV